MKRIYVIDVNLNAVGAFEIVEDAFVDHVAHDRRQRNRDRRLILRRQATRTGTINRTKAASKNHFLGSIKLSPWVYLLLRLTGAGFGTVARRLRFRNQRGATNKIVGARPVVPLRSMMTIGCPRAVAL